jgi:hypothetical protein
MPFQFHGNFVSLGLLAMFYECLNDSARIVLEYYFLHLSPNNTHKFGNMFPAFFKLYVFLPRQRPDAFCVCEERRVGF